MKPLHFSINVRALDCYIYGGYIFIAMQDGDLVYIQMHHIINALSDKYKEYASIFKLAFNRNDYFSSAAGRLFLEIPEVNMALRKVWKRTVNKEVFVLEWNEISDKVKKIDSFTSPVLDMRLYAMNLYLGCQKGLYESKLNLEDDNYHILPSKLDRRFDAKVIGVNSGYGSIVVSSGNNGLFNAPFKEDIHGVNNVCDKPDSAISYRTTWASTDLINYEDTNSFEYLKNDVEETKEKIGYSKFDTKGDKFRIIKLGSKKKDMSEMIKMHSFKQDDVLYAFNSSQSSFFYTKDGIYTVNLLTDNENQIYLSSRKQKKYNTIKKLGTPLSASIVPAGCVIEFFDKTILFQGGKVETLEISPTFRVRSFMSSYRYRNLVAATKMDSITIHSLEPFETYRFQPEQDRRNRMAPVADVLKELANGKLNKDVDDLPF